MPYAPFDKKLRRIAAKPKEYSPPSPYSHSRGARSGKRSKKRKISAIWQCNE